MKKKNLPIKIFEKRKEVDERRVEGGGSKKEPKWTLSDGELAERVELFSSVIINKIEDFQNRDENRTFIPTTIKVEINPDALAKSHRTGIKKLFDVNYKSNLIGFSGENNVLVKMDNVSDVKAIQRNISDIKKHKIGLSAITDVQNFEPFILLGEETPESIKVSMINYQNYEINSAVEMTFESFCADRGINFKKANYSPELTIYKVTGANEATVDQIREFEAIESISFMPEYDVNLDFVGDTEELSIKKPDENVEYPVVGVLDSGVSKNKFLEPWLLDKRFTSYPEDRVDNSHGTFVSGVILYGDELEKKTITGLEGCKIFDATVMPDTKVEKIMEDELIENIREAISENPDIKIWNISLGSKTEADLYDFSDFGQALDNIQKVHDVVICKSAGNCTNFKRGNPRSRITRSADSVLSLVVGSVAHKRNTNDLVEIGYPSPFTRTGNGPSNIIKPELVSYGGNAHVSSGDRIVKNGVKSISPDGHIVTEIGTSFSTPRVSALLAALNMNITEEFNPLLLKALAIHSASYPASIDMKPNDKLKQMGFGLPEPAQNILHNNEHEITLILQDNLIKGEYIEILEFPYPESLIDEEGFFTGQINLTLVSSPVLKNQGSEYCQSNLEVKFGTYDDIKERDTTKSTIINEIGPDGAKNVLREAYYSAKFKKETVSDYANERLLINYGKKYNPIKKYSVNLSEMTNSNKQSALESPKKWFLRVEGLYRNFAEEIAQQDGEELNQDFALIITIKDGKQEQQVYNEVSQMLDNRNFNHSNINLRAEVRVNNQLDISA